MTVDQNSWLADLLLWKGLKNCPRWQGPRNTSSKGHLKKKEEIDFMHQQMTKSKIDMNHQSYSNNLMNIDSTTRSSNGSSKESLIFCGMPLSSGVINFRSLKQCHVQSLLLPPWSTVRRQKYSLRSILNFEIREHESVLCKKAFTLSLENIIGVYVFLSKWFPFLLENSYAFNHLEFYPHDPRGKNIHALYQSQKWREELDPEHQVQMVAHEGIDFYIFEPVGLSTTIEYIVVPIYFYKYQETLTFRISLKVPVSLFAKIYSEIRTFSGDLYVQKCGHSLISSELQEQGKIICHVPITLYADETLGNTSKQWNNYGSYCMTMRPSKLAKAIAEELNKLTTLGCVAHDCSLKEDLPFMKMPLCFLADSPMAGEVTNTPHSGASNNPCRICHLRCPQGTVKCSLSYIKSLFGNLELPEPEGRPQLSNLPRRDRINFEIMGNHENRIYNPFLKLKAFDGCKETPVDILLVILLGLVKYLTREFMGKLKMASKFRQLNPNTWLLLTIALLKEFRIVFQAAFVYFPFMNNEKKDIWKSLCHLSRLPLLTVSYLDAGNKVFP
ncbi:hypothetical protein VP01_3343g3 [Puccinia sorghi]|uniref:Uncharacterized protein n=1 Tax=Puccinia sorghi TaxID=27349 RepID=A0A0L6UX65_9BASI|nr:hypothetical protein VP01_3343g3 [Puccinia sorghi]